jgi:hypothetical protein
MKKYAKVINQETGLCEVGLGTNIEFYQSIGMEQLDVQQSDIDGSWYLADKCPMKTDEQKAQEEKERIAKLSLTRGDVFRALYLAKQVTREQIRAMIENNELISEAQRELALIDFDEALNFYRGNTLIDTLGLALGITSEQLDLFFEDGNYEHLLPKEEPTEEPTETPNIENLEA